MVPVGVRDGEWYFCRGIVESATGTFRSYDELGTMNQ